MVVGHMTEMVNIGGDYSDIGNIENTDHDYFT